MNKKSFVFIALIVIILASTVFSPVAAKTEKIPQVSFLDVTKGESVTIVTNFMPENTDIIAYMGELDSKGENGIVVGQMNTGSGGSFSATLPIPAELKDREYIVVRLAAPKQWYCYNTFQNDPNGTTPVPTPKPSGTPAPDEPVYTVTTVSGKPYKGYPIFAIKSVDQGKTVTVITDNFPPGLDFVALIGKLGKNGEDGTAVGQFNSGEGGAFEATFAIPAAFKDYKALAIRLVAPKRYFAYSWFDNSSSTVASATVTTTEVTATPAPTTVVEATPAPTPAPTADPNAFVPKPGGPRIEILSVVAGQTIKVKATNLHPNLEYVFTMGPFGEAATMGKEAGKFTSDNTGAVELSLTIPEAVKDLNLISIIMESSKGYAFNFFYNITTAE
ncbi:MAG TPA: hypothetical protein VLR89_03610 [Anaerolineaceae bacterium]|nr:hypothetical protein [Anaerolineaceae bacterium]